MERLEATKPIDFLTDTAYEAFVQRLTSGEPLERHGYAALLTALTEEQAADLQQRARHTAQIRFGTGIYVRGLIEISNYCRNNCYYCGIRRSNPAISRYRLSEEDILACCRQGADIGFRTFVLQGGEDPQQDDAWLAEVVRSIRRSFPEHAITLSVGERSEEVFPAGGEARRETQTEVNGNIAANQGIASYEPGGYTVTALAVFECNGVTISLKKEAHVTLV